MDIARGVEASLAPSNDRETDEHGGLFALAVQEGCSGDIGEVTIRGENAVSTATAGMDDTFGHLERVHVRICSRKGLSPYPFVVEALDLLAENEVLEQGRAPFSNAQAVLVRDGATDIRSHEGILVMQVEFGQEFLGGGRSIAILAALVKIARG